MKAFITLLVLLFAGNAHALKVVEFLQLIGVELYADSDSLLLCTYQNTQGEQFFLTSTMATGCDAELMQEVK